MELDEEILARIWEAKVWDRNAKLSDFQLNIFDEDLVLVHLKTGRSQKIRGDEAELFELNGVQAMKSPKTETRRRC